jgi:hypothetical protein
VIETAEPVSESAALQELIDTLDPSSRTFYAEAMLGRDAKDFFTSELGRYMLGCAKQDMESAYEKLKTVSPWRRNRIRDLQNEVRVAEQFILYIRDLILRGKAAELALEERDDG